MSRKKTVEEFVRLSSRIHGNTYDYSKVDYVNNKTHVCIICPEHGEFWQTPQKHLNGQGCPICANKNRNNDKRLTKEEFIERARAIHGDRYDYSMVKYVDNATKVDIICREHGVFKQSPSKHWLGQGCPICAGNAATLSKVEFIHEAEKIHENKYDYSLVEIGKAHDTVKIICPIHGVFEQTPKDHLRGRGCLLCGNDSKRTKLQLPYSTVVQRIIDSTNGRYDISGDVPYVNRLTKIKMICPIHGEWMAYPSNLWRGVGCPKCAHQLSKAEDELYDFLCELVGKEEVIRHDRTILSGREIDLLIPKLQIGVEYNGLRWHSTEFKPDKNYHLKKLQECNQKGIKLIQIFEDEWIEHREIVLGKLRHILGKDNKPRLFARNCTISEIDHHQAREFLKRNHIQGSASSTIHIGAYYNNEIVAVMSFLMEKGNTWNLTRFATTMDYMVIGIGGKLFKFFERKYHPLMVKSFADRRWTTSMNDNLYTKIGFKLETVLPPDYAYVDGARREHKFKFRKDRLIKKYGFSESMTEDEMTKQLGLCRIYNCGLLKYMWKKA